MSLRRILGFGLLGLMLTMPLMYSAPPQGAQQRKGKKGGGRGKKGGGKKAPTRGGRGAGA